MANRRRGEVEAIVDGRPRVLCLTLGALAELEAAFAVADLPSLAERFAGGRLSARDVASVFAAGLGGGGTPTRLEDVFEMHVEGGLVGIAAIVADLLALTFGDGDTPPDAGGSERGGAAPVPPSVPGAIATPSPGTR
ncbi:MAG: gene transfer agent family protein [Phyllobacteriaceae bacterium]|nr:gene transfer agent family protein [Phyllobacteriaceae bacterium]